ncbi:retrovirus-related pol polyprotein from transposon TNT 1-94 [Tanacetum coccineum]
MHNNVMAADQNGNALRKCILKGQLQLQRCQTPAVPATEDSPAVPEQTTVETVTNMTPENRAHFESEKEAIHLILTGIGDEIYSTVDACQTAQEMWEAIERLQQGESLNIQDVKNNLFWEFGNNLTVATMQVNVQFLQQLQPEWSRFVTIVKQQHKLDEVSYHKLFDILKQYQKEVNELRAERMAKNANPLALVATAQTLQGLASEEDSDPEQAQKDKDMQKNLALIAKYFKKLYKPTNNNLRTSSNTRNKNVDTTPRYKNDNQTGQFGNQRAVNVVGARETVGGPVVQQSGIQCFNCKEFGHYAKECRKPKRVKDSTYHKEKMLLCKQAVEWCST